MRIRRFRENPIIRLHMDGRMGNNVNGPSLIRVPDWIERPLGRYYLYFAHHDGAYIRLAYADHLAGPWRTHEPGVLDLAETGFIRHIASPDVHADHERRHVRLYFHGVTTDGTRPTGQATRVALSGDGLRFAVQPDLLGRPYFRVFRHGGWHYAIGMPGFFYRSRDGLAGFEPGHNPFPAQMRHTGLRLDGDVLSVFYTLKGDCPERILRSTVDLRPNWTEWQASSPAVVLEPELPYEGVDAPQVPSQLGAIYEPAYQLRDPYVFREDAREYLLYAVAGEQGIAIAEIVP
jgi:hypothetical protein